MSSVSAVLPLLSLMFVNYKNKCNETNIHSQNESSQQISPQIFLTVLSSSCCHLRVLLFISKNAL